MFLAKSKRDFKEKVAILANRCCVLVVLLSIINFRNSIQYFRFNSFSQSFYNPIQVRFAIQLVFKILSQSNSISFCDSTRFQNLFTTQFKFVFRFNSFSKSFRNPIQVCFSDSTRFHNLFHNPIKFFISSSTIYVKLIF
jgi:hypothetical protein